jgi:hypothetical protein
LLRTLEQPFTGSSRLAAARGLARELRQEGTLQRGGIIIPKKAHRSSDMVGCSRETVTRALAALQASQMRIAVGTDYAVGDRAVATLSRHTSPPARSVRSSPRLIRRATITLRNDRIRFDASR